MLLDVGDDVGTDLVMKARVLAVAERERENAGRIAHAFGDGAAVLDFLQRVFRAGGAGGGHGAGEQGDAGKDRFLHGFELLERLIEGTWRTGFAAPGGEGR